MLITAAGGQLQLTIEPLVVHQFNDGSTAILDTRPGKRLVAPHNPWRLIGTIAGLPILGKHLGYAHSAATQRYAHLAGVGLLEPVASATYGREFLVLLSSRRLERPTPRFIAYTPK
jgi:hypothetical protein